MKWKAKPKRRRPLTTAIVAKREDVDARTVARWCDEGLVPAWKTPGGSWRIARNYAKCCPTALEREWDEWAGGAGTS